VALCCYFVLIIRFAVCQGSVKLLSIDRFFFGAAYVVIQADHPSVAICLIPFLLVFYFMVFYVSFLLSLLFLISHQFSFV
jgi:hypothetical protein